jgi:hypothetical protein
MLNGDKEKVRDYPGGSGIHCVCVERTSSTFSVQCAVEQVIRRLKQSAGLELKRDGIHPLGFVQGSTPPAFARRFWLCFIDSDWRSDRSLRSPQPGEQQAGQLRGESDSPAPPLAADCTD